MKNSFYLFAFILILFACDKNKLITYEGAMTYGENLLNIDKVTFDKNYSFGATVGKKAKLKVILTNLSENEISEDIPSWNLSNADGWNISDYDSKKQIFTNTKEGNIELKINLNDSPGSLQIDYYENSGTVTKTKLLTW